MKDIDLNTRKTDPLSIRILKREQRAMVKHYEEMKEMNEPEDKEKYNVWYAERKEMRTEIYRLEKHIQAILLSMRGSMEAFLINAPN